MSNTLPRLILFSGLGVDETLFAPQRSLPARIEVVPWVSVDDSGSLSEYAHRLAATIDRTADGPLYVGGVSFGAMLALEAASVLRPRGVFLIAGARTGKAVAPFVRATARFSRRLSDPAVTTALLAARLLLPMLGPVHRRHRKFLLDLAGRGVPWLTSWGGGAIADWPGPSQPPPCPVHQIHGELDPMIPLANLRPPPDVVVPRGGHVINLTHAEVVNAFIARRLTSG